ncbi:hypothetical protein D3C81_1411250 [compost metagenome]
MVLVADVVDGIGKLHVVEGQRAPRIGEAPAGPGNAERLARGSTDQDVGGRDGAGAHLFRDPGHVAQVADLRVVVRQHRAGEGINFREPRRLHAERFPGEAHRLDAAAHAPVQERRICGVHGVLLGLQCRGGR